MTTQANYKDEWLDRAFQLAFFLHGRRDTAKAVAAGAMNKLETASNAQFKRHYYTPTGRAEAARPARSRVSLSDLQLLQRLVFVESENFEREKEKNGSIDRQSLLKFFLKHLVRISLKRNSFYVTLAVSRILHNYATSDAMEIYNIVVQDPERVHDDYYYRSRKGVLMKELRARFGERLETVRVTRGEERFQAGEPNEKLSELALESLRFFTPWNSNCALPEKFDPFEDVLTPFYFDKRSPDEEHRIEVNRIHAALHPDCFQRLAAALRLPPPEKKLEIPKFMFTENRVAPDDNDWRNPPHLEADELRQLKEILTAQAESRKAMTAGFLRVLADGAELANFDPEETAAIEFELDAGAELIEIYASDKGREILLATHLLDFGKLVQGKNSETVLLEGGQKISFLLKPTLDDYGEVQALSCTVNYAETAWRRRLALGLRRPKKALAGYFDQPARLLKPALGFGLLLVALTLGWLALQKFGSGEPEIAVEQNQQKQNGEIRLPEQTPNPKGNTKKEDPSPESKPKDLKDQNIVAPKRPEPAADRRTQPPPDRAPKPDRDLEIKSPPKESQAAVKSPRRDPGGTDENGTLRLPIIESPSKVPDRQTDIRGSAGDRGKALSEIKFIYLEISGDPVLGKKLAAQISAEIQKTGVFTVTEDREQADAAFKIYVRHESDGELPGDATVAAIIRLVNAKGYVVYPNSRRVSGWKYVGTIEKLPVRIAGDFLKAAAPKNIRK